jgi:hypothetical protein
MIYLTGYLIIWLLISAYSFLSWEEGREENAFWTLYGWAWPIMLVIAIIRRIQTLHKSSWRALVDDARKARRLI